MQIKIRLAENRDAHQAIDVVRESIKKLCIADHHNDQETLSSWLANKTVENFGIWISNPDNYCVVAEIDNKIYGVGILHSSGEIRLFYVSPEAQHRGIGKIIYDQLEQCARRWGLDSLYLDSTNKARRFYESVGFLSSGASVHRTGVLNVFPYRKQLVT